MKFNVNSNDHLSLLFFGGSLKNKKEILFIDGLKLIPLKEWKCKKDGFFKTNEEILNLISRKKNTDASKIASLILRLRGIKKQLNTYYQGIKELVYDLDTCVHANYNHTSTETGRLSCNKPNLQNIPDTEKTDSKIKEFFISRY